MCCPCEFLLFWLSSFPVISSPKSLSAPGRRICWETVWGLKFPFYSWKNNWIKGVKRNWFIDLNCLPIIVLFVCVSTFEGYLHSLCIIPGRVIYQERSEKVGLFVSNISWRKQSVWNNHYMVSHLQEELQKKSRHLGKYGENLKDTTSWSMEELIELVRLVKVLFLDIFDHTNTLSFKCSISEVVNWRSFEETYIEFTTQSILSFLISTLVSLL